MKDFTHQNTSVNIIEAQIQHESDQRSQINFIAKTLDSREHLPREYRK